MNRLVVAYKGLFWTGQKLSIPLLLPPRLVKNTRQASPSLLLTLLLNSLADIYQKHTFLLPTTSSSTYHLLVKCERDKESHVASSSQKGKSAYRYPIPSPQNLQYAIGWISKKQTFSIAPFPLTLTPHVRFTCMADAGEGDGQIMGGIELNRIR